MDKLYCLISMTPHELFDLIHRLVDSSIRRDDLHPG